MPTTATYDAFISYRHRDSTLARELYDRLRGLGYSAFLDRDVVRPGESVRVAIERALYASQVFVPLFDTEVDRGANLFFELGLFMGLRRDQHKIIPVVTDRFELYHLPPELAAIQVVRWDRSDPSRSVDQLAEALGPPSGAQPLQSSEPNPDEKRVAIEITIQGGFAEFSIEKQEEILKQIQKLLDTDAIRIQSRREG